jgi:hypothetical protein
VRGATLDQDERACFQQVLPGAQRGAPAAREHEEPLIGAAVPIVGTAFTIARRNDHGGSLASLVAQRD